VSSKHQNGRPKNLNFAWKVRDKDLPSVHNSDCFDLIIEMVICFGFMDCCCCSCRGKKSSSMTILKMFDILVSASLHPFHKGSSHSSCLCLQIELKSFFLKQSSVGDNMCYLSSLPFFLTTNCQLDKKKYNLFYCTKNDHSITLQI